VLRTQLIENTDSVPLQRTLSSRKLGREVSFEYKANLFIGYMSSKSQWALSHGRPGSPPLSSESKQG